MSAYTVISATVYTEGQEHAAKAAEVLTRAALGLALDGIDVTVDMRRLECACDPEDEGSEGAGQ